MFGKNYSPGVIGRGRRCEGGCERAPTLNEVIRAVAVARLDIADHNVSEALHMARGPGEGWEAGSGKRG